jgi:hypothetical protein
VSPRTDPDAPAPTRSSVGSPRHGRIPSSRCQDKQPPVSRAWPHGTALTSSGTVALWAWTSRPAVSHQRAGGARRDRTDDLLLAKQALSQLSYGPFRIYRLGLMATFQARSLQGRPSHRALVGLERFELSTSRLSSARSNQLSYRPEGLLDPAWRGGCPSEERETKAAVSRKWSQRLAPHLAPDVSKHRERTGP